MRTSIFLLALLLTGCGYGSRTYNPGVPGNGSPPAVSILSPASAVSGGPAFALAINGRHFAPDAVVFWNMQPVTTMFVSGNQLVASIPAANIRTAAKVPVYVSSAGMNSNVLNFTVE